MLEYKCNQCLFILFYLFSSLPPAPVLAGHSLQASSAYQKYLTPLFNSEQVVVLFLQDEV